MWETESEMGGKEVSHMKTSETLLLISNEKPFLRSPQKQCMIPFIMQGIKI